MRRLNRIAKRMQIALERKNFDADLTPENWEAIENDGKLNQAIETLMEGANAKLTNGLVEGIKYAIDNGINGKKFDYLVSYLDERKTADDVIKDTIVQFVDVFGPIDYVDKIDKESFINLTAKGARKSIEGALKKIGVEWNTSTLEEVIALIDVYFGGKLSDYNTFKLVDLAYVYFMGGDDDHLELMKKWRKQEGLSDEIKHEIRNLIATNADITKLEFITTYADLLDEGDPTTIVDDFDGDINTLYDAVENGTLDDVLYPGLVEGKLQRAKRTASLRTRRMHTARR